MALFEFLITVGQNSENHHCDNNLYVENHLEKHKFLKRTFGNITISFLYYGFLEDFCYEDNEYLILIRGTVLPDSAGNKPSTKEISSFLINEKGDFITQLRGHFNIIKLDKSTNKITVINDYFGLKPVYYGSVSQEIILSSSLELIRRFNPVIDTANLIEKLIFEHNLINNTIFEKIHSLKEAEYLSVLNKQLTINSYFNWYATIADADSERKFSMSNYNAVFCTKVNAIADRKRTNLITLTGGHDGRAILSGFWKLGLPVETFSFGRPGSENTAIPEMIAKELNFSHFSIYLMDDYENNYYKNALRTCKICDGELSFNQQTILYSFGQLLKTPEYIFTGLLAGEVAGPVHLKRDIVNPLYFDYVLGNVALTKEKLRHLTSAWFDLTEDQFDHAYVKITENINKRKEQLNIVSNSKNSQMFYLADMITWGFRRFYGYQMHLIRQFAENIPVFYDFDLISMLINSNYNGIYKNSYKSLFSRRNSRKLQIALINENSKALSKIILDRGYTPKLAANKILTPVKVLKYILRKKKIESGKQVPDFLSEKWVLKMFDSSDFTTVLRKTFSVLSIKDEIIDRIIQAKTDNITLSNAQIRLISMALFLKD